MKDKSVIILKFTYKTICALLATIVMCYLTSVFVDIAESGLPVWAYLVIMGFGFTALGVTGATGIVSFNKGKQEDKQNE